MRSGQPRKDSGFTLLEVLLALALLTIGLLGVATLFPLGIQLSAQSTLATSNTLVAQRELEQLRQNVFSGSFVDLDGNLVDVSCAGAPGTSCGNPLTAEGLIDFSLPPAVGYSVELRDSSGRLYAVRWNISVTASDGRKIVLAAQPGATPGNLPRRVHLQTLVAR